MDHESHDGSQNGGEVEAWQKTRAGKRIEELKVVEEVCRFFLRRGNAVDPPRRPTEHCCAPSLCRVHPRVPPSRPNVVVYLERTRNGGRRGRFGSKAGRIGHFGRRRKARRLWQVRRGLLCHTKRASVRLARLFRPRGRLLLARPQDVQLALRTSIRHLRVSRTSAAPLTDPSFGSLVAAGPAASAVGPGGVALADLLRPLEGKVPLWDGKTERVQRGAAGDAQDEARPSVAALELEREAWADLVRSLEAGRPGQ